MHGAPGFIARGKRKLLDLGHARATIRVFVSEAGARRVHRFKRGESRALAVARLVEQLAGAEYLGNSEFDASTREPR